MTKSNRQAFSLVEVLVVIGIIGVMLGFLLPAVQKVRDSAQRLSCQNNLRQIGLALHSFHDANGRLPHGPFLDENRQLVNPIPWMAQILPHLEQEELWKITEAAYVSHPMDPNANPPHTGLTTVIKTYLCPADGRLDNPLPNRDGFSIACTSYMGVAGSFYMIVAGSLNKGGPGVMGNDYGIRLSDILDGTSNTLAVGERPPPDSLQAGSWYSMFGTRNGFWGMLYGPQHYMPVVCMSSPGDCPGSEYGPGRVENPCDRRHFWSLHQGGANFLFADGGCRYLRYDAKTILPALSTRSDGEIVEIP